MTLPGVAEFGVEQASWADHDALAAEHAAFFASILDDAAVVVDAEAGRRALAAALAVSTAIAEPGTRGGFGVGRVRQKEGGGPMVGNSRYRQPQGRLSRCSFT